MRICVALLAFVERVVRTQAADQLVAAVQARAVVHAVFAAQRGHAASAVAHVLSELPPRPQASRLEARNPNSVRWFAQVYADEERRWTFVPAGPWPRGAHRLVVETTIEDLAGNNIGKPFEVDIFDDAAERLTNLTVKLPFAIP